MNDIDISFRRRLTPILAVCLFAWVVTLTVAEQSGDAWSEERKALAELKQLTTAPALHDADGYTPHNGIRAVYFDALPYKGKPTRAFAWLGIPQKRSGRVPGIVLIHGGGGSAFKNWVEEWTARGFAAISVAVEGQTDQKTTDENADRISTGWMRHAWSGPSRGGVYHDSGEPMRDQWMYHAVADTILANSLLRSLPEVDSSKVGVMGVSWGGIIVSTVLGIDTRFAFGIPVYGCGHLFDAPNHYSRALANNRLYREIWDPVQHLHKANMPILWLSWPKDLHFPMECLAASYGAAAGLQQVALVPGMGHGQGAPQKRPEPAAFAASVLNTGRPWCRQIEAKRSDAGFQVTFESDRPLDKAVLISTTDRGLTGKRTWVETPAGLKKSGDQWTASSALPPGTTGWFINVHSGNLISSSFYEETTE